MDLVSLDLCNMAVLAKRGPAPFNTVLRISIWGSILNSVPPTDPGLTSATGRISTAGFHASPRGEHWGGMGRERAERGTRNPCSRPLPSWASLFLPAFVKQPDRRADFSSLASSSTEVTGDSTVPTAVSEQEKEPGQRALQTTCWFISL